MALEDDVKSWLQSTTILASVLSAVIAVAGTIFKLEFPNDFVATIAPAIAGVAASGIAIYGRIKAVKKIG